LTKGQGLGVQITARTEWRRRGPRRVVESQSQLVTEPSDLGYD